MVSDFLVDQAETNQAISAAMIVAAAPEIPIQSDVVRVIGTCESIVVTPNVELTDAVRLYRAASSDRRERG